MKKSDMCGICRYSCKNIPKQECTKMYPKDALLGLPIHFKEDPTKRYPAKHESTSRICVVCKEYFNHTSIKWIKLRKGLYSMCQKCAQRHVALSKSVVEA